MDFTDFALALYELNRKSSKFRRGHPQHDGSEVVFLCYVARCKTGDAGCTCLGRRPELVTLGMRSSENRCIYANARTRSGALKREWVDVVGRICIVLLQKLVSGPGSADWSASSLPVCAMTAAARTAMPVAVRAASRLPALCRRLRPPSRSLRPPRRRIMLSWWGLGNAQPFLKKTLRSGRGCGARMMRKTWWRAVRRATATTSVWCSSNH